MTDPHGGYTCEDNERMLDDAQGELNMIAESLFRRGYRVNFKENDSLDHWVGLALREAEACRPRRWWRRG